MTPALYIKCVLTGNTAYLIKGHNAIIYDCKRINVYILQSQTFDSRRENILTQSITLLDPVLKKQNKNKNKKKKRKKKKKKRKQKRVIYFFCLSTNLKWCYITQ